VGNFRVEAVVTFLFKIPTDFVLFLVLKGLLVHVLSVPDVSSTQLAQGQLMALAVP
jgi:hypothetical protein